MHTKLPWTIDDMPLPSRKFIRIGNDVAHIPVKGGKYYSIKQVDKETQANAKFIVRACNSHYDLLEACKEAYDALKDIINASDNGQPYSAEELDSSFSKIASDLYDLIAKAETK